MSGSAQQSARDWFDEAERAYVEGHQACASCGRAHKVYRGRRGQRLEYYCPACDFYAFHDEGSGQFYAVAGREVPPIAPVAPAALPQAAAL